LILCGHCGADRLVPLSFTPPRRDDRLVGGWPAERRGPIFKCTDCGRRLHAGEVVRGVDDDTDE
jgi:hypothetical protein